MTRLHTSTRGICNWRERLAAPDGQWRRHYSALEAAASWELAAQRQSGIPEEIEVLLDHAFGIPELLFAVAEHKVPLPGWNKDSQNDLWGLVKTESGTVSLAIEAKVNEGFGDSNLEAWLKGTGSVRSRENRKARWDFLRSNLPDTQDDEYQKVAYQLLHRTASAVIEARRFGLKHAACIIQTFGNPEASFEQFSRFCEAIGLNVKRGGIEKVDFSGISLAVGWADCLFASDQQIASLP